MEASWKKISNLGFFCISDQSKVDVQVPQVMHCMLCYEKLVDPTILGQKIRLKKELVSYFKCNGITTLKKHVDGNHFLIARKFVEEMNININFFVKIQLIKKGL
jgi:hypothetical protein